MPIIQLRNPRLPELEAVEIEALADTGAVHLCIPAQIQLIRIRRASIFHLFLHPRISQTFLEKLPLTYGRWKSDFGVPLRTIMVHDFKFTLESSTP